MTEENIRQKQILMYVPNEDWQIVFEERISLMPQGFKIHKLNTIICNDKILEESVEQTSQIIHGIDLILVSDMPGVRQGDYGYFYGVLFADAIRNRLNYSKPMIYIWFERAPKEKGKIFTKFLELPITGHTLENTLKEYL